MTTLIPQTEVTANNDLFSLQVVGEGMIDACVADGDIVVMKKTDRARNGEMVAVWLPTEGQTVLRYYELVGGVVHLRCANPLYPVKTYVPDQVQVLGRVSLVIRNLA